MNVGTCKLLKQKEIPAGKTVTEAAKLLKKHKVRHLYVTKQGIPLGIISPVDIVNDIVALGKQPGKTKVEQIMKYPIYACQEKDSLVDAYFKIAKYNLAVLPVMKGKKIRGLLTAQEVMRLFAKKGSE